MIKKMLMSDENYTLESAQIRGQTHKINTFWLVPSHDIYLEKLNIITEFHSTFQQLSSI